MAAMTAGRLRTLPPQPDVDIRQIIQEAQNRWLRPIEVCEILRNYKQHNFKLNPVPPTQPPSGSLFLFDRKALRYFRKDGHNWRKKKDGKTVREAHERLKAGSIDVLHCYYAHGEDNPNFQRRAYWMLDVAYEHIVLVHYREVTENNRSCILRNMHDYTSNERLSSAANPTVMHPQLSLYSNHGVSSLSITTTVTTSMASPETVEMAGTSHSPELDDVESADPEEFEEVLPDVSDQADLQPSLLEQLTDLKVPDIQHHLGLDRWESVLRMTNGHGGMDGHMNPALFPPREDFQQSFSDMHRLPLGSSSNFSRIADPNSINLQLSDVLDSPGPSYAHQGLGTSSSLGTSGWNVLESGRGNGARNDGGFVKQEFGPSPWAAMFAQVTTPLTRTRLLEGIGLSPELGQSPLGRDAAHSIGAPMSPKGKGIVDALSPRNLGRMPQSALEADLRDVTEKKVLKEAEEKAHQAQRNRWQTSHAKSHPMDLVDTTSERIQGKSGTQQMDSLSFGEPDTLGALVRSGQLQQQQQLQNAQDLNLYEQQTHEIHGGSHHDQGLELPTPQQQNNFAFLDNVGLFSPTVEHLLKDVRSDDTSNLDVMENYKKLDSFGKLGSFGKLDSFGRWMSTNEDITEIPLGGTSGSLWDSGYQDDGMSAVPQQMDDVASRPSPSLSEQLYNIIDFSPEWGTCGGDTKVIISGSFVKIPNLSDHKWCCMFGHVEVPAELLGEGSLRCRAPPQDPGSVHFYVTRGNRQACSQVREFEYRSPAEPSMDSLSHFETETRDDLLMKIRLSRMLLGHATVSTNSRIAVRRQKFDRTDDDEWRSLEDTVVAQKKPLSEIKEQLLQVILNRKLQEWLRDKSKVEDGRGPRVLDDRGQGIPHFLGALGYVWSVQTLSGADIPINFRDASGWTALHWAAKYGREKMVVALLEAGAVSVLASDPSHKFPRGETAADLASACGHGGIAAFLAEKALTERLSGLTLNETVLNEMDKMTADLEGEKAVAYLSRRGSITRSVRKAEDQVRLRESLEAVRTSTHAAALINSAFRQYSFRRREQLDLATVGEYGLSTAEMHSFVAARKIQQAYRGHQKNKIKQHLAATRIQQKFRGWKGRKDFQAIRQRIIKLQAHVRGRLVRNHYKKIIWSVCIVEKVVLRWLRKRRGFRGFQPPIDSQQTVDGNEDLMREGRDKQKEAVEEEVEKVVLMARQKSDRDQYSRLVEEQRRTSASKGELNDYVTSPRDYME